MSTHVPEHPTDWEAQRDRLSALLDGQLGAAEAAELRAHVAECVRCTEELAALRRVVGALGALPQIRAPRSFALPLTSTLPTDGPAPLPIAAARAPRSRWVAVSQWAGAVAACLGFVILASTFLLGSGYAERSVASFGADYHGPSGALAGTPTEAPSAAPTPKSAQDAAEATAHAAVGAGQFVVATPTPVTAAHQPAPLVAEPADPRAVARTAGTTLL
ncbi:MAG TPA: zf-HC2 domain-containing protein, partial [Steroidobacteraceae bacterium]|nr:zf-HC2 domain-containing protein [Steroidobacteraceae bacterium]